MNVSTTSDSEPADSSGSSGSAIGDALGDGCTVDFPRASPFALAFGDRFAFAFAFAFDLAFGVDDFSAADVEDVSLRFVPYCRPAARSNESLWS